MFDLLPDQWTPIAIAGRPRRGQVVAMKIAGESLAVFRDRGGRLGALIDRCPHRGVALSGGRVTEAGTLACPFHGWKFERDGRCAQVPFCDLSEDKRARLGATAIPILERGGLLWVFTGLDARGTEPELPDALGAAGWSQFRYQEDWSTHWTRAMENMLDYPHLPYVHQRTIGRALRAPAESGASLALRTEATPTGMRIHASIDARDSMAQLEWRRPNGMVLHLHFGRRRMRQHVYCVPIDRETTRMILISTRDFGRLLFLRPLFWLSDWSNAWILREDKAVVESSRPSEVPPPGEEKSVAIDAPTLAFRRWYFHECLRPKIDVEAQSLVRSEPA